MNRECHDKLIIHESRQRNELSERMCLLPIQLAAVQNRAIATPIADCCYRIQIQVRRAIPMGKYDRLQSLNPLAPTERHVARFCSDRETNCNEMRMGVESHVNALRSMPELNEAGIQVEINPRRNTFD